MKNLRDFHLANMGSGFALYFVLTQSFKDDEELEEVWAKLASGFVVEDNVLKSVMETIDRLTTHKGFLLG